MPGLQLIHGVKKALGVIQGIVKFLFTQSPFNEKVGQNRALYLIGSIAEDVGYISYQRAHWKVFNITFKSHAANEISCKVYQLQVLFGTYCGDNFNLLQDLTIALCITRWIPRTKPVTQSTEAVFVNKTRQVSSRQEAVYVHFISYRLYNSLPMHLAFNAILCVYAIPKL